MECVVCEWCECVSGVCVCVCGRGYIWCESGMQHM